MNQEIKKGILKAVKAFSSGTLLSRFSGLLRDMSMAAFLGPHPSIAALFVAIRISNFFRRLFGEGAMQSAFVPHFEELRVKDENTASKFFKDLHATLFVFLSFLVLLGEGVLYSLWQWGGFDPENQEILKLSLILFPSTLFICLFGINASLLHCEKKFFLSSVAPVAFNLTWSLAVFFLQDFPMHDLVEYLTMTIVLAYCLQWLVTVPPIFSHLRGVKRSQLFSPQVKKILAPLFLGITGVGAAQLNSTLDAFFARAADLEGPMWLWYALRIQQLPMALISLALSSALLPPLSKAVKSGDIQKHGELLSGSLKLAILLLLPLSALMINMSSSSVSLLYYRGEFNEAAVLDTSYCLVAYLLGLLPMSLTSLLASSRYAHRDYASPVKASLISVFSNIVLNSIFIFTLGWGAVSVALATSFSAFLNLFFLLNQGDLRRYISFLFIFKVAAAAIAASILSNYFVQYFFPDLLHVQFMYHFTLPIVSGFSQQVFLCVMQGLSYLIFATGFGVLFRLFKKHQV